MVGVTVNVPMPVAVAALKNLTAAGAVEPAGTANGYVMLLVGFEAQTPAQEEVTPVMVDDVVASDLPPPENRVEVIVAFQPVSETPRAELSIVSGTV
jgi:hypothetical protein